MVEAEGGVNVRRGVDVREGDSEGSVERRVDVRVGDCGGSVGVEDGWRVVDVNAAVIDAEAATDAADATAAPAPNRNAAGTEAAIGTVEGVELGVMVVVTVAGFVAVGVAALFRGERTATNGPGFAEPVGTRVAVSFTFSAFVLIQGGRVLIARPGVLRPALSCVPCPGV
jgi:hypothetical protein